MFMFRKKLEMPSAADALPGRTKEIPTAASHYVLKRPLKAYSNEAPVQVVLNWLALVPAKGR